MSLASIFVFLLVFALQLLDRYLDLARKRGAHSDELTKLRLEIKQLLEEADLLSTPSTFAQAAKLKRLAAAKEKELAKMQEQDLKGKQSLYDKYAKFLLVTKVIIYAVLVLCFWSTPVTTVPQHLLQPFGKMFSWRGVDTATGHVVVGILPWLFLTSRVSKLLCQKFGFVLVRP
ncbi:protein GET1-like isoform X2 [Miscanthus floridulus]